MGHLIVVNVEHVGVFFVDEFEASAMAKAKETEAQSEPDDGEEDSREEGKFLKCSSSIKITNCNAETLKVGRSQHYFLVCVCTCIP